MFSLGTHFSLVEGEFKANMNNEYGSDSNSISSLLIFSISFILESHLRTNIIAGPSGFEPETAGFLSIIVKSPVLYLAELRALR